MLSGRGAFHLFPIPRFRAPLLAGQPSFGRIRYVIEAWNIGFDVQQRGTVEDVHARDFQNVFITGCDIPEISDDILQEMFDMLMKYDMISLRLPNNRIQPLPLGMSKKVLPIIEMQLNSGHFALHDLIMACQTYPEMTSAVINIEKSPVNINTIADLNNYETP